MWADIILRFLALLMLRYVNPVSALRKESTVKGVKEEAGGTRHSPTV